jgi:hypothetical protein
MPLAVSGRNCVDCPTRTIPGHLFVGLLERDSFRYAGPTLGIGDHGDAYRGIGHGSRRGVKRSPTIRWIGC